MSTTVDITTVTNAIEALSISGVTVLDVDEITDSVGLEAAILAEGWILSMRAVLIAAEVKHGDRTNSQ